MHGGNGVVRCQGDQPVAAAVEEGVGADQEGTNARFGDTRESGFEVGIGTGCDKPELCAQNPCCVLDGFSVRLIFGIGRVCQHRDWRAWHQFDKKLKPLRRQMACQEAYPGQITLRPVEMFDEVARGCRDDRDSGGRPDRRRRRLWAAARCNDVDL